MVCYLLIFEMKQDPDMIDICNRLELFMNQAYTVGQRWRGWWGSRCHGTACLETRSTQPPEWKPMER